MSFLPFRGWHLEVQTLQFLVTESLSWAYTTWNLTSIPILYHREGEVLWESFSPGWAEIARWLIPGIPCHFSFRDVPWPRLPSSFLMPGHPMYLRKNVWNDWPIHVVEVFHCWMSWIIKYFNLLILVHKAALLHQITGETCSFSQIRDTNHIYEIWHSCCRKSAFKAVWDKGSVNSHLSVHKMSFWAKHLVVGQRTRKFVYFFFGDFLKEGVNLATYKLRYLAH